jgi:membrane protein DedA with SNARE-associated domain
MDPLNSLVDLVSASPWTYAVILAIAAVDALIPLVPSEATVIAAGVLAGAGELELGLVIAAGAAGAYAGDTAAYWLGRRLDYRIDPLVFSGAKGGRRKASAERVIARHGGPLIFGARFVPGGRTATTFTAGVVKMRWAVFAAYAAAAGVAWATYCSLVGYIGGRAFQENLLWGLLIGFGFAALSFLVIEAVRRVRGRRAERQEAASARSDSSPRMRTSSPNSKRSSGPPSKSRSPRARV